MVLGIRDGSMTNHRPQLEKRLVELHGQIRLNQIEAGRIISDLRKTFKHGEWMPYSRELFLRLKISRKTADRYVDAFQKAKDIGEPIVIEAEAAGLNLNRIPVREALLETKKEHPDASANKIVKMTNLKLEKQQQKAQPTVTNSNVADFVAVITNLRSRLSGLNQLTKQVQNGSANRAETETLVAALQALAKDAQQRASRLTEVLNGVQEKAA